MPRRSRAREVVLQVLYQQDLNPDQAIDIREQFVRARLNRNASLIEFAQTLVDGVLQHRDQIDESLKNIVVNWKLGRMARIDRNILRLGAYEILFSETPDRVVINESIELAKRYGNKQSSQFVNGILDRLMKRMT